MTLSYDKKKIQEVILFFARSLGGTVEMSRFFLLLYRADMQHLAKHGTLISSDTYIAMNYGPVPFHTHVMLIQAQKAVTKKTDKIRIEVSDNRKDIVAAAPYNTAFLADSEVECIFEVIRKYKTMSFDELSQTVKDEAWRKADNGEINLIEMARAGQASPEMIAYIKAVFSDELLTPDQKRNSRIIK